MENIIKAIGKEAFERIAYELDAKLWNDVRQAIKDNGQPIEEEHLGEYTSDILYHVTDGQFDLVTYEKDLDAALSGKKDHEYRVPSSGLMEI